MIGTRESIESELRKRDRRERQIMKSGGTGGRVIGERFPGDDDLDDERNDETLRKGGPTGEVDAGENDDELEVSKREAALLALFDRRRTIAKSEALTPSERALLDDELRRLQGRREREVVAARAPEDDDAESLSKAESSLLDCWSARENLRKAADLPAGDRFASEDALTEALRKLGHERALQSSEGYRKVQALREAGGSLL